MKIKYLLTTAALATLVMSGCSLDANNDKEKTTPKEEPVKTETVETVTPDTESTEETKNEVSEEEVVKEEEQKQEVSADLTTKEIEGISYSFPSDLQQLDIPDQGLPVVAYLIDPSGANFNIVVETLPFEMSLGEYMEAAKANTGFEYLSEKEFSTDNGLQWNETVSNNQGLKLTQRTFLHDGKAYVFSFTAQPDTYDEHIKIFDNVINSVILQ